MTYKNVLLQNIETENSIPNVALNWLKSNNVLDSNAMIATTEVLDAAVAQVSLALYLPDNLIRGVLFVLRLFQQFVSYITALVNISGHLS